MGTRNSRFEIFQLRQEENNRKLAFVPLKYLRERKISIQRKRYDLVYSANMDQLESLDVLYFKFNVDQPADFTGHSLSISDVVVLQKDGISHAFYVDDKGFTEVPEFLDGLSK